jgi:hypothetical protein
VSCARLDMVGNQRGAALIIALLIAAILGAIGASLVTLTMTEALITESSRHAYEASYGAEAALERALHDLATLPDWSAALQPAPSNVMSTFVDGATLPIAPDGRTLDLASLTASRQRESDARDGPAAFGANAPQWRLYAHAPLAQLLPPGRLLLPVYVVVWVADDGMDGDGDAGSDANGTIVVRAEAFGLGGARRAVEGAVGRTEGGALRLIAWREGR